MAHRGPYLISGSAGGSCTKAGNKIYPLRQHVFFSMKFFSTPAALFLALIIFFNIIKPGSPVAPSPELVGASVGADGYRNTLEICPI